MKILISASLIAGVLITAADSVKLPDPVLGRDIQGHVCCMTGGRHRIAA